MLTEALAQVYASLAQNDGVIPTGVFSFVAFGTQLYTANANNHQRGAGPHWIEISMGSLLGGNRACVMRRASSDENVVFEKVVQIVELCFLFFTSPYLLTCPRFLYVRFLRQDFQGDLLSTSNHS